MQHVSPKYQTTSSKNDLLRSWNDVHLQATHDPTWPLPLSDQHHQRWSRMLHVSNLKSSASSLKHFIYALSISFGPCLMLERRLRGVMYLRAPWNWCINIDDNCSQEMKIFDSIWKIHFLVVPDSMTAKHLQRAKVVTWSWSIWSLKASRWSWGSVLPSYVAMVGILKLSGSGACWISVLNNEIEVDWVAAVFLAANFLSLALSSFISSFIREMTSKSSLLLEVVELCLTSRCLRISSPRLRPSRSKTLHNGLRASSVTFLSCDLTIASGLVVRPDAVMFWGWEGHTSLRLLLTVVAERVDLACEHETCRKFPQWVEVALPRVVALATCYSTCDPLTVDWSLGVGWAAKITVLSSSCLMVWMAWLVSSIIPSSWACRFTIWARSTSVC